MRINSVVQADLLNAHLAKFVLLDILDHTGLSMHRFHLCG